LSVLNVLFPIVTAPYISRGYGNRWRNVLC